jgi:rubrerythrin
LLLLPPGRLWAQSKEGDLSILSAALALEHEAVAAYQFGIDSEKLSAEQLKYAVAFQGDESYHRDGLIGAIKTLGGEPVEPRKDYGFGQARSATDFIRVVHMLEQDFIRVYAIHAASVQNKDVLNFAARILADEVRHLTVWQHELGIPNYGKPAAFSSW